MSHLPLAAIPPLVVLAAVIGGAIATLLTRRRP